MFRAVAAAKRICQRASRIGVSSFLKISAVSLGQFPNDSRIFLKYTAIAAQGECQRSLPVDLGFSASGVGVRHSSSKTDEIALIDENESLARIDAYGVKGFIVNNVEYYNPVMVYGSTALLWNVKSVKDISVESLAVIELLKPSPELLLIGCGSTRLNTANLGELEDFFGQHGTVVEIMDTGSAASTFNVLNQEGRSVAAALLPPK